MSLLDCFGLTPLAPEMLVPTPSSLHWFLDPIARNGTVRSLFRLPEEFLRKYRGQSPAFGFNGLGNLVYQKTYSRLCGSRRECWFETIQRVVEGVFEILLLYQSNVLHQKWDEAEAQQLAQEMYDRMFSMKLLPPGRGLEHMGTATVRVKGLAAALNNCSFCSTKDFLRQPTAPFTFAFDAQMLGCGIGFDVEGAGQIIVHQPAPIVCKHIIEDSREGSVESLRVLLDSYLSLQGPGPMVEFDYSRIRAAGEALKTFGGVSSGPEPLKALHQAVRETLDKNVGKPISKTTIVDLFNLIGKCVVSGNIRRTAQLALGPFDSEEFLHLKDPTINKTRLDHHGWASNNSVIVPLGSDFAAIVRSIRQNGEPGVVWLENMKKYARMNGTEPNEFQDPGVQGGPPCLEQSLESMELCCLAETFPAHHDTHEDFQETLKCALVYAKAVTLLSLHWEETHEVMHRNRRLGISVTGIAQFLAKHDDDTNVNSGFSTLRTWLSQGYDSLKRWDAQVSRWLRIPMSIKLTCVKPSGTVSLLAGATPGVHFPISRFYIRRVRLAKDSPLVSQLSALNYPIEPSLVDPETTVVVEFPVKLGDHVRTLEEVSMKDQLELTVLLQECWADNQVSTTISFSDAEENQLEDMLQTYQYRLKSAAFFRQQQQQKDVPQIPYQSVSEAEYKQALSALHGVFGTNTTGVQLLEELDSETGQSDLESTDSPALPAESLNAFCDSHSCLHLVL